jgi:hypothetical protein
MQNIFLLCVGSFFCGFGATFSLASCLPFNSTNAVPDDLSSHLLT